MIIRNRKRRNAQIAIEPFPLRNNSEYYEVGDTISQTQEKQEAISKSERRGSKHSTRRTFNQSKTDLKRPKGSLSNPSLKPPVKMVDKDIQTRKFTFAYSFRTSENNDIALTK